MVDAGGAPPAADDAAPGAVAVLVGRGGAVADVANYAELRRPDPRWDPLTSDKGARGTAVGDGGDGFSMSRGRRPGLCHAEMAAASVCVQGKGRWTPDSGGSSDCRNHRSAIRQGQGGGGGGEKEGRVATVAFVLDVREV